MRVLRHYGVDVEFPAAQTCCGQPAFNAGFRDESRRVAKHFLEVFESSECIVCPSGSCAAMVKEYYPSLFQEEPELRERFEALAAKTWELSQFLTDALGVENVPQASEDASAQFSTITWHDCCHSLRGLGVREGPRQLLDSIAGCERKELTKSEECCGFGGLFSVKYDSISEAMLEDKVAHVEESGAECLVATDCSCLMHIDGGLRRKSSTVKTRHIAEIIAAVLIGDEGGES